MNIALHELALIEHATLHEQCSWLNLSFEGTFPFPSLLLHALCIFCPLVPRGTL